MKGIIISILITALIITVPRFVRAAADNPPQSPTPAMQRVMTQLQVIFPTSTSPAGLSPQQLKTIYGLPAEGGEGTIAIVEAFHNPETENELNVFSKQYDLPSCSEENGCFEIHRMSSDNNTDRTWALTAAIDSQWSHAIAPNAKILMVEAKSDSLGDMLSAVDYARSRDDVAAVSMAWGLPEWSDLASYDTYFTGKGVAFFAPAGNNRDQILWPAVSSRVVSVGGTSLQVDQGRFIRETAWKGSGGGLSKYVSQPHFQLYAVPVPKGKRAVPDVAFSADPEKGVSVYKISPDGKGEWYQVGGTGAGTAPWAAIRALSGATLNTSQLYMDAMANSPAYFHDVTEGNTGEDGIYCSAGTGYDYMTGLGSPATAEF